MGGLEQRKAGSSEDGRLAASDNEDERQAVMKTEGKRRQKMESDGGRERTFPHQVTEHGAAGRRRLEEMSENEICERSSDCGKVMMHHTLAGSPTPDPATPDRSDLSRFLLPRLSSSSSPLLSPQTLLQTPRRSPTLTASSRQNNSMRDIALARDHIAPIPYFVRFCTALSLRTPALPFFRFHFPLSHRGRHRSLYSHERTCM